VSYTRTYRPGERIKLPPGTRLVRKEGRVFIYQTPGGQRVFVEKDAAGNWLVEAARKQEFADAGCDGDDEDC
jgi:hypothetical protein